MRATSTPVPASTTGSTNYPENDTRLLVHDHIRNNTDLVDIIAERNPGRFISSTYGNARIDFMYASPSMYEHAI